MFCNEYFYTKHSSHFQVSVPFDVPACSVMNIFKPSIHLTFRSMFLLMSQPAQNIIVSSSVSSSRTVSRNVSTRSVPSPVLQASGLSVSPLTTSAATVNKVRDKITFQIRMWWICFSILCYISQSWLQFFFTLNIATPQCLICCCSSSTAASCGSLVSWVVCLYGNSTFLSFFYFFFVAPQLPFVCFKYSSLSLLRYCWDKKKVS